MVARFWTILLRPTQTSGSASFGRNILIFIDFRFLGHVGMLTDVVYDEGTILNVLRLLLLKTVAW